MSAPDTPEPSPTEPHFDLKRHNRTPETSPSCRDWEAISRRIACPGCGAEDTRFSRRQPWYGSMFGMRSRRCRHCRMLFAHFRPIELMATLLLGLLLLGAAAEAARRYWPRGESGVPQFKGGKNTNLPPPVER